MPNTCVNYEKKCGGCPLLALPYREQLAQKQARLQELLGGFAPVKAVQGMAEPLHYRNKAIASFATQRGKLVCGLYAEGTHRVLPGADCLLQEEILNKTLAAVLDAARACRWTAYDEDRGTGLLRHTVLRSSGDGKVLVTLVTPGPDLPGSKNFCTALRKKAPWVVSIVQNINPTRSSAVLGSREKTLYGPGFVLDTLCGTQFAISSRSFYQVNRTQTEVLYKKALELAKLTGRETVIDAYCGIGTIGLCAAPLAKQVIGVERNPAAVKDAAANARRNKIANARFVCADATEWMAAAAGEGLHPDVVFLDPPRAGSTPECIAAVNKMKPRRVVYVSCDPETLARDVAAFTRLGWRAAKFCPVDLFPHQFSFFFQRESFCFRNVFLQCLQNFQIQPVSHCIFPVTAGLAAPFLQTANVGIDPFSLCIFSLRKLRVHPVSTGAKKNTRQQCFIAPRSSICPGSISFQSFLYRDPDASRNHSCMRTDGCNPLLHWKKFRFFSFFLSGSVINHHSMTTIKFFFWRRKFRSCFCKIIPGCRICYQIDRILQNGFYRKTGKSSAVFRLHPFFHKIRFRLCQRPKIQIPFINLTNEFRLLRDQFQTTAFSLFSIQRKSRYRL